MGGSTRGGPALELAVEPKTSTGQDKDSKEGERRREEARVEELAGYGTPSSSATGVARYALWVLLRRLQLSRRMRAMAVRKNEAAERMNEALLQVREKMSAMRGEEELRRFPDGFRSAGTVEPRQHGASAHEEALRQAEAGRASDDRRRALIELGRMGLEDDLRGVADFHLAEARQAMEEVDKLEGEEKDLRQAVDTYDFDAYRSGVGYLVASVILVLALAIGLSFLFGGGEETVDLEQIKQQQAVEDDW